MSILHNHNVKTKKHKWKNNDNKGLRMGISFTMNVIEFKEVLCMISELESCDGSVDVYCLTMHYSRPHLQYQC